MLSFEAVNGDPARSRDACAFEFDGEGFDVCYRLEYLDEIAASFNGHDQGFDQQELNALATGGSGVILWGWTRQLRL